MAQKVENVNFEPRGSYPWDEWTDGDAWIAEQGEDFECSVDGFIAGLYSHANRTGQKVKTKRRGNTAVYFQFEKKGD